MMKKAFHFILKALSVLKVFKISFSRLGHLEKNSSIRNIRLISKFMTSQPGYQTITMNIFPTISRSKDNQIMKFVR